MDALRAEAMQNAGSLHARLAPLRDRADLPAAAAELIRSGTERERIIALLALREAAHRGQAVAEPALLALADSLAKVRAVAVRTLGMIGWSGARAALESAIHDDDRDVREHALRGLLEIDGPAGRQQIAAMLHDVSDRRSIESVLGALEAAKFEELPPGFEALTDHPDPDVRRRALTILGYSAPADPLVLYRALRDASAQIRIAALGALMRWQSPPPASALPTLLSDPDRQVWKATLFLIVLAQGPRHAASLEALPSSSPEDIAEPTAVLGGQEAIPRIATMLTRSTSERDALASWRAARLAGAAAPDAADRAFVQPLRAVLKSGSERVRLAAVRAAASLGADATAAILEHWPAETDERIRAAALQSLTSVLGANTGPHLRQALNDPSERVRGTAAEELGRNGSADDIAALEQARPPTTPMEEILRWAAIARLRGSAENALAAATRALADPAHTGRMFTQWYAPGEDLCIVLTLAGTALVRRGGEDEVSTFTITEDGALRIGAHTCSCRIARVRIHGAVTSTWGHRVELSPDPWSHAMRRTLETASWSAG